MVDGLLILLLFQFLGELVIHFTGLPLPPPMKVYCGRHATKRDRDTSLHKAAKGRQAGRTHRHSIVRGEARRKICRC